MRKEDNYNAWFRARTIERYAERHRAGRYSSHFTGVYFDRTAKLWVSRFTEPVTMGMARRAIKKKFADELEAAAWWNGQALRSFGPDFPVNDLSMGRTPAREGGKRKTDTGVADDRRNRKIIEVLDRLERQVSGRLGKMEQRISALERRLEKERGCDKDAAPPV